MRASVLGKLLAMAGMLVAFIVVVGVVGVLGLRSLETKTSKLYVNISAPLADLATARSNLVEQRALTAQHILAPDAALRSQLEARMKANTADTDAALARVQKTLLTANGRSLMAQLAAARKVNQTERKQVLALSSADEDVEAFALYNGDAAKAYDGVIAVFDQLLAAKVTLAKGEAAKVPALADLGIDGAVVDALRPKFFAQQVPFVRRWGTLAGPKQLSSSQLLQMLSYGGGRIVPRQAALYTRLLCLATVLEDPHPPSDQIEQWKTFLCAVVMAGRLDAEIVIDA